MALCIEKAMNVDGTTLWMKDSLAGKIEAKQSAHATSMDWIVGEENKKDEEDKR